MWEACVRIRVAKMLRVVLLMLAKQKKLAGQKQRPVEVAGVVISAESDPEEFPVCCFGGNAAAPHRERAARRDAGVDTDSFSHIQSLFLTRPGLVSVLCLHIYVYDWLRLLKC